MNKKDFLRQAISNYLFQVNNSVIAEQTNNLLQEHEYLIDIFLQKFALEGNNDVTSLLNDARKKIEQLPNEQKFTLERVINFIDSVVRTSYYKFEDNRRISFKIMVQNLLDYVSYVKPKYEIFVFSENVEGCHLRVGNVSRGGIRWSDLKDRYRFEVLQLVASQYLKNAVIVPEGSKGCFYIKEDLSNLSNDDKATRVAENYKTFIRGLLDLTDNIVKGKVVHPEKVQVLDGEDPYLVVAADKGTARFSDIANEVSKEYNFWLDDAFASGGKNGYDHKAMGITAKGAWQVAKHHLYVAGINVEKDQFTAVGVGDMGGDVFGNGMLEFKTTKLVAAFNHKHIFIDPNPKDLEQSYNERLRLFKNVQGWDFYNKDLISKGGGVFLRSCNEIKVSQEMKDLLDIKEDTIAPNNLIKSILKARVDLLWFGGIGTYVISSTEDNEKNADKANKDVRVTANELRVKVVAEGANLGTTTRARHELNTKGILDCGDIVDNSGGVFASDKEVNIKILLNIAMEKGLLNYEERNTLLNELEEGIADRILYSNYQQALIVGVEQRMKNKEDIYEEFFKTLKQEISFSKENAVYSQDDEVYTKSEISLLLLCDKLILKKMISESGIAEKDSGYNYYALQYFPKAIREKFEDLIINHHPLKHSIISMMLANKIANHYGIGFIFNYLNNYSLESIVKSLFAIEYSFNVSAVFKNTDHKIYDRNEELYEKHISTINIVANLLTKVLKDTNDKDFTFKQQCDFVAKNYSI